MILDPAFGDMGRLYTGFDAEYVQGMKRLCRLADIILPNVTEACFLLDIPYAEDEACSRTIEARCGELIGGQLRNVLVTSCRFPENRIGLICVGDDAFTYPHDRLGMASHGSGDLFASVFSGMMMRCGDIRHAAHLAADFTYDCLDYSMKCEDHRWYGVDYEAMLPELARRLREDA